MSEVFSFFKDSGIWATIDAVVTLITLVGVGYGAYKFYKSSQNITIYFENPSTGERKEIESLQRQYLTRSEVQGVLRNKLKKGRNHFDIDHLSSKEYLKNILDLQSGTGKELVIKITDDEMEVFRP